MPEGPEVKIASNYLNKFFNSNDPIVFEIITKYYNEKYKDVFKTINKELTNFKKSYTIGKNIFIDLNEELIFNFHLGMTGGWSKKLIKHCHFKIHNNKKELFFIDVRKFGKMRIISKSDFSQKHQAYRDILNIEYNIKEHINFLTKNIKTNPTICAILMNQKYFPGVGNYIKSETLYACSIHPEKRWQNISRIELKKLIITTKEIMHESLNNGGAELRDFNNPFHSSKYTLKIYGRKKTIKNEAVKALLTSDYRRTWICTETQKL
tara:strand:+ start:386 stop:1180 length:795 start_codon:yes stop_codon:yes gene_type:complete